MAKTDKPNILIIWGDDIGWFNISANNQGITGYRLPAGAAGVLLDRYHASPDLILVIDAQQKEILDGAGGDLVLPPARALFERLFWYDQVTFDSSNSRPGVRPGAGGTKTGLRETADSTKGATALAVVPLVAARVRCFNLVAGDGTNEA